MKKRQLIIFPLFLSLCLGCKSIKYSFNETIKVSEASMPFDMVQNRMVIHPEIDGRKQSLIFDLGAMVFMLFDTSMISDFSAREKSGFGNVGGAGKGKISIQQLPLRYKDGIFYSENMVFRIAQNTPFEKDPCNPGITNNGLYGAIALKRHNMRIGLDFDSSRISNFSEAGFRQVLANGYNEIRSHFSNKGFTIEITIQGLAYSFLFDTGFNGSLVMGYDEALPFINHTHFSMEGMEAKTLTGITTGITDIYQAQPLLFGTSNSTGSIYLSRSIRAQNIGMELIKQFNWLIDYKEKRVYCKPGNVKQAGFKPVEVRYVAAIIRDKLIVTATNTHYRDFKIGDRIVSVGGVAVTEENKCSVLKTLSSTVDWKLLNVVTASQ